MADRSALLMTWLEGEGERQRRPLLLTSAAKDPSLRGWVQVAVCALAGVFAVAILPCWLVTAWEQSNQMTCLEQLRLESLGIAVGDPNRAAWWKEKGATVGNSGSDFGVLLCLRVFGIIFGTVIGALFLRVGCLLHNKLTGGQGSPNSVPIPVLGKAMGITFVSALVNAIPGFGFLSALVGLLVMAAMISALLPTTFARGILVSLCYLLVGLCVVVVLAVIFGGLFLVLPRLRGI